MRVIFPLMFICYFIANIYIFIRTMHTVAQLPVLWKIIIGIIFWSLSISLFASIALAGSHIPEPLIGAMYKWGSIWLVFILYMSISLVIFNVARYFFPSIIKNSLSASLTVTFLLLIYGYINYLNPQIKNIDITIDKPIAGDSITIVGISDLHMGYGTGKKRVRKLVNMINEQSPDAVIIAGDLIDNNLKPLYSENMGDELEKLVAPMGIFMAPGNHEYICGIKESIRFVENTPVKMLIDNVATLPNGIQIICRDDATNSRRLPLKELLLKADVSKPTILIDHQPLEIALKDSHKIDVQFSGHTHNGQIWPGSIITSKLFEQAYGYRKWKYSHVYVSSGASLWGPPFRIGTNNEIVVFKIRSGK